MINKQCDNCKEFKIDVTGEDEWLCEECRKEKQGVKE